MLVDDFIMRQIQQIAAMVTSLVGSADEELPEDYEEQIDDAYRSLLGMGTDLVETMDAESVLPTLDAERVRDALITLTVAHADVSMRAGDPEAARRRIARALSYLPEGDARSDALLERFDAFTAALETPRS